MSREKKRFHIYFSGLYRRWRIFDRERLSEYICGDSPSEAINIALDMAERYDRARANNYRGEPGSPP